MSTDIATGSAELPERFTMPTFDIRLERLIDLWITPHPEARLPTPTDIAKEAAQQALDLMAWMLEPADQKTIVAWLWPVIGGVRNPPPKNDFARFVAALMLVTGEVPRVAWTRASQREAVGRWVFMPSAADVIQLVRADAAPLQSRVRALRQIVAA